MTTAKPVFIGIHRPMLSEIVKRYTVKDPFVYGECCWNGYDHFARFVEWWQAGFWDEPVYRQEVSVPQPVREYLEKQLDFHEAQSQYHDRCAEDVNQLLALIEPKEETKP